jgi:hypothetical protein
MTSPVPPPGGSSYEPRVISDSMPPARAAASVTWAALPLLSLGWATPLTFTAAALWRRRTHLVIAALVYVGIFMVQIVLAPQIDYDDTARRLFHATVFCQAIIGCFHAFYLRRGVFDPHAVAGTAGNEAAIGRVRMQRVLRQKARDLARDDPGLAKELRIGRPDLRRQFNDGGLVDVNHAPPEALTTLPGITGEMAERVVRLREETGCYVSAEELSARAELPPSLTPDLAEYTIFLP